MRKRGGKKMSVNMPISKKKVTDRTALDPNFLKSAERLPVKNGKITLDRKNPDHVRWAEGYEEK